MHEPDSFDRHGHGRHHHPRGGRRFGQGDPAQADPGDGTAWGRGGGRGHGRGRGWRGEYGPGFGGPMFGRGPKVGRGDVRAAILALLAEEPMHGYQIITELTDRSGGVWQPSPGSVYPTLSALEDQGLVTADKPEGKRVFQLTPEGRAEAEAAGDGPAPWDNVANSADRSLVDLRLLMVQVMKATKQVAEAGAIRQVQAVADILTDARRQIYLVLADGDPGEDPVTGGTPAHPADPA
jgi:DNA-binding PadR family transcriptional regulator